MLSIDLCVLLLNVEMICLKKEEKFFFPIN